MEFPVGNCWCTFLSWDIHLALEAYLWDLELVTRTSNKLCFCEANCACSAYFSLVEFILNYYTNMRHEKFFLLRSFLLVVCLREVSLTRASRTINIATPGDMTYGSSISLPIIAPAIDTALTELRVRYAGIFDFTQEFVFDPSITDWSDMPFYVDDMMARWYYRRQRPQADLTAFIYAGELTRSMWSLFPISMFCHWSDGFSLLLNK